MSVELIRVKSERELKDFMLLPFELYRNDPAWVPPLLMSEKKLLKRNKHPFHKHSVVEYLLAKRDGRYVGRMAVIVNHQHNQFHKDKAGFFGFFDCENSPATARELFDVAEKFLKLHGLTHARGPMNFSVNETCGALVEGFDTPPYFMMPHNPAYLPQLIEHCGYHKAMDLLAYRVTKDLVHDERFQALAKHFDHSKVKLRPIDLGRFRQEIDLLMEIYNDAWSDNWGFVPMTPDEVEFMAKELKRIFRPELSYMAEVDGTPVGFAFALPNINPILKKIRGRLLPFGWFFLLTGISTVDSIRVMALGVRKQYQRLGLGALLCLKFIEDGSRLGIREAEMSWVLETNRMMILPLERMGAKPYKRYRIYEKPL